MSLANNVYLVLQPQYRGSQGYGMKFYTALIDYLKNDCGPGKL